jgi:hypothetical protein
MTVKKYKHYTKKKVLVPKKNTNTSQVPWNAWFEYAYQEIIDGQYDK